jgi:hypothetical protein
MAFNVIAKIGDPVPTSKDNEVVHVQVVQVSGRDGVSRNRVEARIWVQGGEGYNGPTKTAITFDAETDIDSLIAALEAAKGHVSLGTVQQVAVVKPRKRQAAAKVARA